MTSNKITSAAEDNFVPNLSGLPSDKPNSSLPSDSAGSEHPLGLAVEESNPKTPTEGVPTGRSSPKRTRKHKVEKKVNDPMFLATIAWSEQQAPEMSLADRCMSFRSWKATRDSSAQLWKANGKPKCGTCGYKHPPPCMGDSMAYSATITLGRRYENQLKATESLSRDSGPPPAAAPMPVSKGKKRAVSPPVSIPTGKDALGAGSSSMEAAEWDRFLAELDTSDSSIVEEVQHSFEQKFNKKDDPEPSHHKKRKM